MLRLTSLNFLNSLDRFDTYYNGMRAAVFNNSAEYHNFTTQLKGEGHSFLTKIIKRKKARAVVREFVVMLVEETPQDAA